MRTRPFKFIAFNSSLPISCVAALALGGATMTASAEFLTVAHQLGHGQFQTIQEAVDAAVDGDTIVIRDGVYTSDHPNFVVDLKGKAVTLVADGGSTVIIDGEGVRAGIGCINGEDGDTRIRGLSFRNSPFISLDLNQNGSIDLEENWVSAGFVCIGSSPHLTYCTFSQNELALQSREASPSLYGCTFEDNELGALLTSGNIDGLAGFNECEFQDNERAMSVLTFTEVQLNNCSFHSNGSPDVHAGAAIDLYDGRAFVSNCSFTSNSAEHGGAISIANDLSRCELTECTFSANSATEEGGAIYITSNTFSSFEYCEFTDNTAGTSGGAIQSWRSNPNMLGCTFEANTAPRGGALVSNDYPQFTPPTNLDSCTFIANIASNEGGAIYSRLHRIELSDCEFSNNLALNHGGAIASHMDVEASLQGCTFTENVAWVNGGAVYQNEGSEYTVFDCEFHRNAASSGSGFGLNNQSMASLDTCTFNDQSASITGAGLALSDSNVSMIYCTFRNLLATEAGGGIAATNSNVSMTAAVFEDNESGRGGAIMLEDLSNLEATTCWFTSNEALSGNGGAISARGFTNLISTGCSFRDNGAAGSGGAVYLHNANYTARYNDFFGNVAVVYGGSIESTQGAFLEVYETSFLGGGVTNALYGGAIDIDMSAGPALLQDINVLGCSATVMGGGVYSDGTDTWIEQSTIRDNSASIGGGVGSVGENVNIAESSICGNTNDQVAHNFVDHGDNYIAESCCLEDLDGNGLVDGGDLNVLLGEWGACGEGGCRADFNHDGVVDGADMTQLLGAWGACG